MKIQILTMVICLLYSCNQDVKLGTTEALEQTDITDSSVIYDYFLRNYKDQLIVRGSPLADSIISNYPELKTTKEWLNDFEDKDSILISKRDKYLLLTHFLLLKGDPFYIYPFLTSSKDTLILNRPEFDAGMLTVMGTDTLKIFEAVTIGMKVSYYIPLNSLKNKKFLRYQDSTLQLN